MSCLAVHPRLGAALQQEQQRAACGRVDESQGRKATEGPSRREQSERPGCWIRNREPSASRKFVTNANPSAALFEKIYRNSQIADWLSSWGHRATDGTCGQACSVYGNRAVAWDPPFAHLFLFPLFSCFYLLFYFPSHLNIFFPLPSICNTFWFSWFLTPETQCDRCLHLRV